MIASLIRAGRGAAAAALVAAGLLVGCGGDDDGDETEAATTGEDTAVESTSTAADANSTIKLAGSQVEMIGEFSVQGDPAAARAAFGPPSSQERLGSEGCELRWSEPGLRITFANLGGSNPRGPAGRVGSASVGGSAGEVYGWSTDAGLALGAPEAELQEIYPDAAPSTVEVESEYGGTAITLVSRKTPIGAGGVTPSLEAIVAGGVVAAFEMYVGAAGD